MNRIKKLASGGFCSTALIICSATHAGFINDTVTFSGIPNIGATSAAISQSEVEVTTNSNPGAVNFYCGTTSTGTGASAGFACGFIQSLQSTFELDIYKSASQQLKIDVLLDGYFDPIDILISGFDSPTDFISGIGLSDEMAIASRNAPFIDPATLLPVEPALFADEIATRSDFDSIASIINLSYSADSVGFSLPGADYLNGFSLLVDTKQATASVPEPSSLGLLLVGAVIAATGRRVKRSCS